MTTAREIAEALLAEADHDAVTRDPREREAFVTGCLLMDLQWALDEVPDAYRQKLTARIAEARAERTTSRGS